MMEIELRIPDDYCQGDASTLYPLHEDDYEEDMKISRSNRPKIIPRNRLTKRT